MRNDALDLIDRINLSFHVNGGLIAGTFAPFSEKGTLLSKHLSLYPGLYMGKGGLFGDPNNTPSR